MATSYQDYDGVIVNKIKLAQYRELKETDELAENQLYVISDIDEQVPIYKESLDSKNPIILRNLDTGIYKIYGYFKYYSSYSGISAVDPFAYLIVEKGSTYSYVTVVSTNESKNYKITDSTYENLNDSGWIDLPLSDGILAYNSNSFPVRYRKTNNRVRIEGAIKGITSKSTLIGTLPEGYRPLKNQYYINAGTAGKINTYEMRANGNLVFVNTTGSGTLLDTDYHFISVEYFVD